MFIGVVFEGRIENKIELNFVDLTFDFCLFFFHPADSKCDLILYDISQTERGLIMMYHDETISDEWRVEWLGQYFFCQKYE